MLKHKFTLRETILLLIAVVLALGIFYYQVILKNLNDAKEIYNTNSLQDQMTVLVAKAAKKKNMEEYIDEHVNDSYGEIAVYNNLASEIDALASVFEGKVDNVSINWDEPTLLDTIVRRNATISFKTNDYNIAKQVISGISNLEYRCIITTLSLSDNNKTSLDESEEVSVTLKVTFFETTDGATNTSGLVVIEE